MGKKSDRAGKTAKASQAAGKLGKRDYAKQLAPLQLQLNDVARWLQHTGKRLMVVIEGRDTAGKGGVIGADNASRKGKGGEKDEVFHGSGLLWP